MDGARPSRQPNIHTDEKIFMYKQKIFGSKKKYLCTKEKNTCISAMKMCYDIEVIDHIFIYVSTHFTRSWYLKCLASAWVQVRRVGCLGLGEDSRSYFSRILNCRGMCQNCCNSAQFKAGNVNIEEGMTFKCSVGCQMSEYFVCILDGLFPQRSEMVGWMLGTTFKKYSLGCAAKVCCWWGQVSVRAAWCWAHPGQQSGSLHQRGEDEGQNWARSRLDPGNIFTALVAGRVLCCCAPGGSELDRNCKLKLQRSLNLTCKMGCDLVVTLVSQEWS